MAKKKGIIEKAADAIDHALHPDKPAEPPVESVSQDDAEKMIESGEAQIPPEAVIEVPAPAEPEQPKSSSQESDLAKHPKFAKFKSQGDHR